MGLNNDSYYIDPEVAEYANKLKDNPDMRLLFDAAELHDKGINNM